MRKAGTPCRLARANDSASVAIRARAASCQTVPRAVCGGSDKNLPKQGRTQEILGMLYLQRGRAEHVADAEKALNEALQYHDKAHKENWRRTTRSARCSGYGFRLDGIVLRDAFAGYRGQSPPYPMQQIERIVLDELESAARCNPTFVVAIATRASTRHPRLAAKGAAKRSQSRNSARLARRTPGNQGRAGSHRETRRFIEWRSCSVLSFHTCGSLFVDSGQRNR